MNAGFDTRVIVFVTGERFGHDHRPRAVMWESEGILGGAGVRVGKNLPTPTPTSI
jgi:hypothetical protein